MKIRYHRGFDKQYKRLPVALKDKTKKTIEVFLVNPHAPSLKNHALKGRLKGLHAISVTYNLRIIFEQQEDYTLVIFLSIGGHDQYR